jgi:uncharacterized protein YeaO (DUF488 family)
MDIRLKRAHELAAPSDGYRLLNDRLWPTESFRGSGPNWMEWEKDPALSAELWGGGSRPTQVVRSSAAVTSRSFASDVKRSTTTPSCSPKCCGADELGTPKTDHND